MKDHHPLTNGTEIPSAIRANSSTPPGLTQGDSYEIKVVGHLDEHWSAWIGDLKISRDAAGHTLLSGTIPDQAALFGILLKIRDLGLPLISVTRLESQS